ncbi:MAG: class I SAM-dependent methyltransferase [Gemmatimonadaceae bacterium]
MSVEPEGTGVAVAYDRWAASYDTDSNATRDLDAEVLRRAPLAIGGRDVLEIGCGTGKHTAWLAEHARTVVGLDVSAGMLARARQRVDNHLRNRAGVSPLGGQTGSPGESHAPHGAHVRLVRHDVRGRWPVPDLSTDVVIGTLVLEHVEALAPVFAEAARVLRTGGQLFLCELHPFRQWLGGQARFTDSATGETVRVRAHVHTVGDYVNGGLAEGFVLRQLGEWLESPATLAAPAASAPLAAPPRLLSLLFDRSLGAPAAPADEEVPHDCRA